MKYERNMVKKRNIILSKECTCIIYFHHKSFLLLKEMSISMSTRKDILKNIEHSTLLSYNFRCSTL